MGLQDLSLKPDPWNRWIYDTSHPDYNSDRAKDLRERRARALALCPQWMIETAMENDRRRSLGSTD